MFRIYLYINFFQLFCYVTVTLDAYVAISPDYPIVAPVFALELLWSGNYTAANHPHVMVM